MIQPRTLKGFRDFLPKDAKKRQYVINTLKQVFESYGFEPLETPALEYEEVLTGKYGEEGDKLMYKFEDQGGRKVALRYDQTVPLARVAAQYQNDLPIPFKRYQIQPVWRAENTQKGRFREFLQCDADIVGIDSALSDAEVIALAAKSIEKLGFKSFKILINDRQNLFTFKENEEPYLEQGLRIIRAVDKIKKIGREGVVKELITLELSEQKANEILDVIERKKPTQKLEEIIQYMKKLGIREDQYQFLSTLARGLDYYTGMIFEIEVEGYTVGSVCGGGRYDKLIGMFGNQKVPAVGFAFGFDRLMEAMEELKLFPEDLVTTKVLVTVFSPELKDKSIDVSSLLRSNNINTEVWLDPETKLDKQIKYADKKGIVYVVIIGPDELGKGLVTLKNLKTREQKQILLKDLPNEFKQ